MLQSVLLTGETSLLPAMGNYMRSIFPSMKIEIIQIENLYNLISEYEVVVYAVLQNDISLLEEFQKKSINYKTKCIPILLTGKLAIVGPWLGKNGGCIECSEKRRFANLGLSYNKSFTKNFKSNNLGYCIWMLPLSSVVCNILMELKDGILSPDRIYTLNFKTNMGKWHKYISLAYCETCGGINIDGYEWSDSPILPNSEEEFRSLSSINSSTIKEKVFDWRYGPIVRTYRETQGAPFPVSISEIRDINGTIEKGYGRSLTYENADFVGIIEALERQAGANPSNLNVEIIGCYNDLKKQAVDPLNFAQHSNVLVEDSNFKLSRYSPSSEIHWVWAYSMFDQKYTLVPEQMAYYRVERLNNKKQKERFIYETSNGNSVGKSLEEAILHGLFEVSERDAFLMTWYSKKACTEVDINSIENSLIQYYCELIEGYGYKLHIINITNDISIPAVWLLAIANNERFAKTFSSAGCHPNPESAILSGLKELVTCVSYQREGMNYPKEDLDAMLRNPTLIQKMEDHVALYTIPESFYRIKLFISRNKGKIKINEIRPNWRELFFHQDLRQSLNKVLGCFKSIGVNVYIVDQTTPALKKVGLYGVKVLVTGTLPMTFGFSNQRVCNVPRFDKLIESLNLNVNNLWPHPFP